MRYHYGMTIREYRERRGMTQAQLADVWPTRDGGVSPDYVSLVERGEKRLADIATLRKLAVLLAIPLWKFGLSEYDPFEAIDGELARGAPDSLYRQTLSALEDLIKRTWWMRRTAPLDRIEEAVGDVTRLVAYLRAQMPPPPRLSRDFQALAAQALRLSAVVDIERERYGDALARFAQMAAIGRQIQHPATIAGALVGIGTELSRAGRHAEAIAHLEEARDLSFECSRQVAAFVHSYLARAYSAPGPQFAAEFRRAIATAQRIAGSLRGAYGDGTDFVFHARSGILAEKSYGCLEILEPEETLAMREEIEAAIAEEGNRYLHAWIPLDWARAHLMLSQIEQAVQMMRLFRARITALGSPHGRAHMARLLATCRAAGFGAHAAVRALVEEIGDAGAAEARPYPLLV